VFAVFQLHAVPVMFLYGEDSQETQTPSPNTGILHQRKWHWEGGREGGGGGGGGGGGDWWNALL